MAIDEKDTAPRLGKLPENIRLKPARATDNKTDSKSLIGGKDSSYLGSLAGSVASGFGSVVSSPFEAADRALAALAGTEYRPEVASPIGKLGQGIEGAIETVAAPDPERAEDFSHKLGAGVGSALGFMLPFGLAGNVGRAGQAAMSGGLGAAATGVEQATDYDQARQAAGLEADPNDQAASLFYGMLPGTLEAVPIARMFGRLDNIAKGGLQAAVKNTAKGTAEEALQEGVQSIASNLIASDVVKYDPTRDMFFDSAEATTVGGGVGFLMNSVFNALGLRGARKARYEQMAQQASQGKTETAPVAEEEKINPATGEEFENSQIAKTNKKIKQYQKLAAAEPQNEAAYKRRIKELKDELNTKFIGPDATGSAIDRQEATDVLSEEQADQQLGLPGIEQAEVQKPTQEAAPVEEEAQVPKNQLALDFEQEAKPETPAVTEAKRKLDEILTPMDEEVVTQDDLVVAPTETQEEVVQEKQETQQKKADDFVNKGKVAQTPLENSEEILNIRGKERTIPDEDFAWYEENNFQPSMSLGVGEGWVKPDGMSDGRIFAYGIDANNSDNPGKYADLVEEITYLNPELVEIMPTDTSQIPGFLQGVGSGFNKDDIALYLKLEGEGKFVFEEMNKDQEWVQLKNEAEQIVGGQLQWVPSKETLRTIIETKPEMPASVRDHVGDLPPSAYYTDEFGRRRLKEEGVLDDTDPDEVVPVEEELILTDAEVQQIAASPASDIAKALKNATEEERGRILKAINDRAVAEKAKKQKQADKDIARAEAKIEEASYAKEKWQEFHRLSKMPNDPFTQSPPVGTIFGSDYVPSTMRPGTSVTGQDYVEMVRADMVKEFGIDPTLPEDRTGGARPGSIEPIDNTSFSDRTPFTGVMHTLRNPGDLTSVLETGLKDGTNIGTVDSQAIGEGITLEYDAADLIFVAKGYRTEEGIIDRQVASKPKRVLIDMSEPVIYGVKDEIQNDEWAGNQVTDMYNTHNIGDAYTEDEFSSDVYEALMSFTARRKSKGDWDTIKQFTMKYGLEATTDFKDRAGPINAALDNVDQVPIPGKSESDAIKEISKQVPSDIAVYTYTVDENGKPENVRLWRGASEPVVQKEAPKPKKPSEISSKLPEGYVGTKAGKAFTSERSAKTARTKRKLTATHEVAYIEQGWVLRPIDDEVALPVAPPTNKLIQDIIDTPTPEPTPREKPRYVPQEAEVESLSINSTLYDTVRKVGDRLMEMQRKGELNEDGSDAQAIIADIFDQDISHDDFIKLYMGILDGTVMKESEAVQTPLGVVESVEAVQAEPAEVPLVPAEQNVGELEEVTKRLDQLDQELIELEEQIAEGYYDHSEAQKMRARIKRSIRNSEARQSSLLGTAKKFAEKEIAEAVAAENTVEVIEDQDVELLPDGSNAKPPPSQREVVHTRNIVNKFYDSLSSTAKNDMEIFTVTDLADIPSKYPEIRQLWNDEWSDKSVLGLHIHPSGQRTKTIIIIKPTAGKTDEQIQWTLFHEVVGHYGFKKMFGDDWTRFMELSLKNKDLASKVLSMRDRWTNIEIAPKKGQPTMKVTAKYTYTKYAVGSFNRFSLNRAKDHQEIEVDLDGMRRLMDEYVAEIAANMSNQTFRDAVKSEQTFLKRVLAWIRHFFRSKTGFGKIATEIDQSDLLAFVGESYTRVTGDGKAVDERLVTESAEKQAKEMDLDKIDAKEAFDQMSKSAVASIKTPATSKVSRKAIFKIDNPFDAPAVVSLSPDALEAQAAIDEAVDNAIEARIIKTREEAKTIIDSIRERKGRNDNSAWARRVEVISDKLRRSRAGRILSSTGHLNEPRILNAVESITKGGIERGQMIARKFANKTKNLNDTQKEAIYKYFKTQGASVNEIPVNDELRTLTRNTKQYIEDLGEALVHLGLMRRETWEADRGSYLSIRYWKYVQNYYAAGGKRLSFKNYLKKQKGLSDAEKQALGEIKDPAFIVPETVATISRDVALHSMFKNILTMDKVGGLGWVLGNSQYVEVSGKKMKLSDIETNIETLEMLQEADEGVSPLWRTPEGQEEIERQLQQLYEAKGQAEQQLRNELTRVLQQRGEQVSDDRINQVLKSEFVKVRDKRYGPLYNKHIRKELYEEIVDSGEMYNKEHTDFMGQWFGVGGKAEKAHQIWKASKVVLNPPSWVRNGIGNMVLLDIGSGTNTIKLVGMVANELNSWRTGNPSKYFHWAHEQGLWNTTFSASELNLMSDQFQEKFKTEINFQNETKFFKKLWWFTQGKFANALEKATNIYGGMEGFFKTVALRDHIEQWEAKNGPLERADSVTQQAVIREAAETANKNIFDYSRVPGWMRTMRRMPFVGAPFLTYTFKAIPQSIESFASRPHKMIKYAAFPYVMAQWFMMENDLDDDDFEELKNKLPKWQKEQSSVFLLPYKDSNGKWQTMDFGYYLPWAAMHNTALQVSSTFDTSNPLLSALEATGKSFMDLGFLGGPMPSMISGLITNKDPFLGQEIIRTNGTAGDKTNDLMRYMVDLWAPTFLTSKGVLGRTIDNLGVEPTPYLGWYHTGRELDARGIDRETWQQSSLRGIGVNVRGFDPQAETVRKVKAYQHEKRGLEKARRDIFKDRNISAESKAAKAKDINQQIKLLNERHRKELHGV